MVSQLQLPGQQIRLSYLSENTEDGEKEFKGNEEDEVGTIRIRRGSQEAIGTVRIKADDDFGTVKLYATLKVSDNGTPTVIDSDSVPDWANDVGSIRISRDEIESGKLSTKLTEHTGFDFMYSKGPEQWEVNILSLENNEWNENMKKDAFGKYKKERPALEGLFSDNSNTPSAKSKKRETTKLSDSQKEKTTKKSHSPKTPGKVKKKKQPATTGMRKSKSAADRRAWVGTKKTKSRSET